MEHKRGYARPGALSIFCILMLCARGAEPKAGVRAVIEAARHSTLQAAFDAVPEGGGMVILPPGVFEITQPLRLVRGDVRVEGAGAATHIINRNEAGQPALLIRPANYAADRKARIWRVQIGNFRISGSPKSGDGVRAEGVQELLIHQLSVDHNGGHGINEILCSENPRIVNCNITYNAQAGINLHGGHDMVISANQLEENQDGVRCIDGFNLTLTGNNIDDHLRHGVVMENTYGSVLSGNMIEQCKGTAIVLDRDCYGITISANTLPSNLDGGLDLRDAWSCTVTGNTFTRVYNYSVRVWANSGRIVVTGNSFNNTYIGGGKTRWKPELDEGTGVVVAGGADVLIANNLFSGLSHQAVVATGESHRIMVQNNIFVDNNRRGQERKPDVDLERAHDSVSKDNIVAAERPGR